MSPELPSSPRAAAEKARVLVAKVRPGATEGRRSLPIRRPADEIRRLWEDPKALAVLLGDLPVAEAFLEFGPEVRDWGTPATVKLRLQSAVPGTATQALAGKVVRRLKALAETGEVPTTDHNPSAREDAT
jgi:hypothetical protein